MKIKREDKGKKEDKSELNSKDGEHYIFIVCVGINCT